MARLLFLLLLLLPGCIGVYVDKTVEINVQECQVDLVINAELLNGVDDE